MTQSEKAKRFRELHAAPPILILPNAWDAASAKMFAQAGFPAIATTSAGIAAAHGYPDGERIPREEMLDVVTRIAASVDVPVTVDAEAGYGDPVGTAKLVVECGAVGMNIEDAMPEGGALYDIDRQVGLLIEIRALALPLVINARTDVFWANVGNPETRFQRAVERLTAYREAGADSLFVPGLRDQPVLAALVRAARGPLNVLASPGMPSIGDLEKLGVARVSTGSGIFRAALAHTRRIASELRAGDCTTLFADQVPYSELT